MEEGKLFRHYLCGEDCVRLEPEVEHPDDILTFRLCIVNDDERIEIQNLDLDYLKTLRDHIDAAIREYGGDGAVPQAADPMRSDEPAQPPTIP